MALRLLASRIAPAAMASSRPLSAAALHLPSRKREEQTAAPQIPRRFASAGSFEKYGDSHKRTTVDPARKAFQYFLVGGIGVTGAAVVKNIVVDGISTMLPSADVLALASVEVDLSAITEGQTVVISWRGKPLFVRHRTAQDIAEAKSVNLSELRHQEPDEARTQKPEWLVMLGVCTHLGCVPMGNAGEYNGWFCPCHGSHYDSSGRIRKGPAPLNLEVPPYKFLDDTKLLVG
eukprot:TRINITY_DN978_c0_g1_i1.p1 TRINITY_DN978_c0_g1~~TRINITY_DN978_c0_g1_i1.p1  ORF type:complete len:233 (-),score=50.89 TRINITY_DN978_c0_g1_i1:44-742(-)